MGERSNLEDLIRKAEELARTGKQEAAASMAMQLTTDYPREAAVWSLRAYLHGASKHYVDAVADLTRAIALNAMEPDFFLNRGIYSFALGEDQSAIEDFSKGLELCDHYNNDYYRETLHFWRAEALLRLGKRAEALADLSRVREDFSFWTYKLRTKADLVADCKKLPG